MPMQKCYTLPSEKLIKSKYKTPKKSVIDNILNFSKSYEVKKTRTNLVIELSLN